MTPRRKTMIHVNISKYNEALNLIMSSLFIQYSNIIFFFFQAEDGIRDLTVTGVQTCALPILMAFPFLILVIAIMSILGPGLTNLYIAVGVVGWIPYARITRGETLATRHLEYVLAARTIGCSPGRIMLRHILPNVIAPALIYVFTG